MTTAIADKIEEQVFKIVAGIAAAPVESVERTSRLREDLGYDSLDEVELMMAIEEQYGFSVSDEEAEKIKTAGDVLEHVRLGISSH